MSAKVTPSRLTYLGLFVVTLATLMYEILLTRIFSVTMWYHYVFVAVSVALFGMTVGATLVYLFPTFFTPERAKSQLALSSLLFAVSIVLSFLTHLSIPFVIEGSLVTMFSIALTYAVLAVPFVFSGICVCLALTRFPRDVNRLYAADLAGAAVGCILLIYILNITTGPTAVIVVAMLASVAAFLFAIGAAARTLSRIALTCGLLLAVFAATDTVLAMRQTPFLRVVWVKEAMEPRPIYEKWNSFSRLRVVPHIGESGFGWGLSPTYTARVAPPQLWMDIDAAAGMVLTAFDGDLGKLEHLKYDVTNIAYYVKRDSRVLVVGTGGGRDILSALVFDQKSVLGVEMNSDILDIVNRKFGSFTGHLDRHPKVTLVNDEARSYVARSAERFDIIQISLVDTWAATAAGAFVLAENSLYTVEAWQVFLEHLNREGVLTVSRWYFRDRPAEMYRVTALASTALMRLGVRQPRDHIVIVRHLPKPADGRAADGIGTILVSKDPFSAADLDTIGAVAKTMQFEVVLSPRFALDATFAGLSSGSDLETVVARYPLNIGAPTDDSPFFFYILRLQDIFGRGLWGAGLMTGNLDAVVVLAVLLVVVVLLTVACIVVPLLLATGQAARRGSLPLSVFFASIGLGFMLVEISQMQRLIIFLGHPTYSLSVVLFVLLLSSGLGSLLTGATGSTDTPRGAGLRLVLLVSALVVFGLLTPGAIRLFQGAITPLRVLVAAGLLFPIGLFMGMAFPLGMQLASARSPAITPWLWGINGATSVCASVLAVAIALNSSISTSYWLGVSAYVVAAAAFGWASGVRVQPWPARLLRPRTGLPK